MGKNISTLWHGESFVSTNVAVTAISSNGKGNYSFVAKIIGHDGIQIRRKIMRRQFKTNHQFAKFHLDGDGLYELNNFCHSRKSSKMWNAFVMVENNEVWEIPSCKAYTFAKQIENRVF